MQTEQLAKLRAARNAEEASACIAAIKQAASDGTNLMPLVIDAVEKKCTLGEISDALRDIYGEYHG